MGTVIVVLVVVVLAAVLGFAVALAAKGRRRAAESLGTGLAANVPREWAGAHSTEAKLHRRLVAAARSLSVQPLGDAAGIERRVAVEQQLRELDEQLVTAAAVPEPARGEALAKIAPLVAAAESAVAAIASERVDVEHLERGQRELDD